MWLGHALRLVEEIKESVNRVNAKSERDVAELRREDLLHDYLKIANGRPGALTATALRTRSVEMRDLLVYAALQQDVSSERLQSMLWSDRAIHELVYDAAALAELGRLVLLQNILDTDSAYGEKLLTTALDILGLPAMGQEDLRILVQHYIITGQRQEALDILDGVSGLDSEFFGYLRAELSNPFDKASICADVNWLESFNQVFEGYGLAPISFSDTENQTPLDAIVCSPESASADVSASRPIVSVVLTAYQPKERELLTSVRSILCQTWENLELIIVNDCSGPAFDELFQRISELDQRITLVNTQTNGGTYAARNIGYARTKGIYITGQDDDDWSHPERIFRQVELLETERSLIGCRVRGIQCNEILGRVRVGYGPISENASSLMIRREAYELAGGYLEARKAADTEFYYRVAKITGRQIASLPEPLTIIRILKDSLSRSDFAPGWRHSARRTFRSSYTYWHRTSPSSGLRLVDSINPKVKIPRRFLKDYTSDRSAEFDVVFAGDWQQFGGPQKSMLEEIYALKQADYRLAVLNLEAARFMGKSGQTPLADPIQKLINEGLVDEVLYDDAVHTRLLVLRYPPILQFMPYDSSSIRADTMIILANQAPCELDGSDIRYIASECHSKAESSFRVSPSWVPQGPQVREQLEKCLSEEILADYDIPGILDVTDWWHDRLGFRSSIPVVGRHSRDSAMKWPADPDTLLKIYPDDGRFDIRIMGSIKTPLQILGVSNPPPAWVMYKRDEVPVRSFLYSLDYFVFYQNINAVEAFGRAILEAIAAGTVVILPNRFREVFGQAALYAEADDVEELIHQLHSDFSSYQSQLKRSKTVLLEHFSYSAYRKRISGLFSSNAAKGY